MQILTHRWLEPLNKEFGYTESSKEAFEDQLQRWFWLEFDINFTWDGFAFVFHDSDLSRISWWGDKRNFQDLKKEDIESYTLWENNHFIGFEELMSYIGKYRKSWEYSALHLKSKYQEERYIDEMLRILENFPWIEEKVFIFDTKIETAKYIKSKNGGIKLLPSVAHEHDITRYNNYTWWTLYSIDEVLINKSLFDWVWLDEWDRTNNNWEDKTFYNKDTFQIFRKHNLLIWLVTPELHATSPWLLWWESHQDCKNFDKLISRFNEITTLKPDFICSDYLEYIR